MKVRSQILNKLKSKKGSALLLAMLFSLICLILGMVILSAGDAANGRIINAAKAEQSYYIASSLFREFQDEASYTYVNPSNPSETVTEDMQLWINTADFASSSFNIENAFTDSDSKHRLTTLKPFVARALYETMTNGSYSNELTFTMGGQGIDVTYTAVVQMTMQDTDYSIYLDVKDVLKGDESLGAPHLHTIAIQCKRITPKAASDGKMTAAIFEYYEAKLLSTGAAEENG